MLINVYFSLAILLLPGVGEIQPITQSVVVVTVQSLSCVWLFVTPWTTACQASPSITNSQSLFKLLSVESVMPSNHLILCCPLLLPPSVFSSIRVFSNEKGRQRENDFSSLTKSSLVRPLHNTSYTSLSPNPYEDTEENFQWNLVYPGNCRWRMLPAISVNKGCCNHQWALRELRNTYQWLESIKQERNLDTDTQRRSCEDGRSVMLCDCRGTDWSCAFASQRHQGFATTKSGKRPPLDPSERIWLCWHYGLRLPVVRQ